MSRMLRVLAVMLVVFAASADAAEVVSIKLCPAADYDAAKKDCAPGKALEGSNIMIDPAVVPAVYLLSSVKSAEAEEVYHVWLAGGKSGSKVSVYDSASKALREAEQAELDWLKERGIDGAQSIVKLPVSASPGYRTRSQKTLSPRSAGPWKVMVFDSTNVTPLAELSFAVTTISSTTTEN